MQRILLKKCQKSIKLSRMSSYRLNVARPTVSVSMQDGVTPACLVAPSLLTVNNWKDNCRRVSNLKYSFLPGLALMKATVLESMRTLSYFRLAPEIAMYLTRASFYRSGVNRLRARSTIICWSSMNKQGCIAATKLVWTAGVLRH